MSASLAPSCRDCGCERAGGAEFWCAFCGYGPYGCRFALIGGPLVCGTCDKVLTKERGFALATTSGTYSRCEGRDMTFEEAVL